MAEAIKTAADIPDDERPDATPGYVPPPKVGVDELLAKDADDASLNAYKKSLLGSGKAALPGDSRKVVILELRAKFADRPGGDIIIPLKTPEDVEKAKHSTIVMKEAVSYSFEPVFIVQHDVCMGLKYTNSVYKLGVRVDKTTVMIGSYPPSEKAVSYVFPEETVPSGMLARGKYRAVSRFTDDDNVLHLEFEYTFEIKKDWA